MAVLGAIRDGFLFHDYENRKTYMPKSSAPSLHEQLTNPASLLEAPKPAAIECELSFASIELQLDLIRYWQSVFDNDNGAPLQYVLAFLIAAKSDMEGRPLGVIEAGLLAGLSNAAGSRTYSRLGKQYRNADGRIEVGANLLYSENDPSNWSRKLLTLTPKGKLVMQQLGELFGKHSRGE